MGPETAQTKSRTQTPLINTARPRPSPNAYLWFPKDQNVRRPQWNVGFLHAVAQQDSKTRTAAKGRLWRRPSGLDFDSFGDHQRIFKLDAEVPDSAVHLGVTQ